MYAAADYTINISDAEGFGLATLESLSCGTPIIVNMTGGLQEQVTDGKNFFGFGIEPASKTVIGSLQVPYIYEDRITQKDFNNVMNKALTVRPKVYKKMCTLGKAHVRDNYGFTNFEESWVNLIDDVVERHGSWDTRKLYNRWSLKEVA
jgi:glycosyltransferase involved in cell wall biosynthesis